MMPIKTYKKIETIVLYVVFYKKNLQISFQNEPEHETISLTTLVGTFTILSYKIKFL